MEIPDGFVACNKYINGGLVVGVSLVYIKIRHGFFLIMYSLWFFAGIEPDAQSKQNIL
jgi:hypothetical protein